MLQMTMNLLDTVSQRNVLEVLLHLPLEDVLPQLNNVLELPPHLLFGVICVTGIITIIQ